MELNQTFTEYQEQARKIAKDGNIVNLDNFQDGRVVRNLLEQGHSPENIEQAVARFSPVALHKAHLEELPVSQKEYATDLINKGQSVIKAVNDIKEFDASKLESTKLDSISEYKQLVKQHFEQKNAITLNSKMDAEIAFKMLQRGHTKTSIEETLSEVSPVAKEAGRSPKEYSEYVTNRAADGWEKHLENRKAAEANYSTTAKEYLDKKEAIQQDRNTTYQEGRIVRELIDRGHDKNNLIKAVAENAAIKEGRTQEGYAKYVVNGIVKEIRAEQNIRNFDANSIDKNEPLTTEQAYLQQAKQLFNRNQETFNTNIDTIIAKDLIKSGFDPEEIKKTISELSPAGKRPGIKLNYPDEVIKLANERIGIEQKIENNYSTVALDYMSNAERVKNANPGREYSEYFDGKIAEQLLAKGHEKQNVQKAISEISIVAQKLEQEKGWDRERYGRAIVSNTIESMSRYEAAKSIQPKENPEINAPTLTEEYQHHLKPYIDQNRNLNGNVDIQIAKDLSAKGYSQEEISKTIKETSPVAVEPGRIPEKYTQYIERQSFGQALERQQSPKNEQTKSPLENKPESKTNEKSRSKSEKSQSAKKDLETEKKPEVSKERSMSR